jgi:hypothetical protein
LVQKIYSFPRSGVGTRCCFLDLTAGRFPRGKNVEFSGFAEFFPNALAPNSREFGVFFGAVRVEVPFSRELRGFLG